MPVFSVPAATSALAGHTVGQRLEAALGLVPDEVIRAAYLSSARITNRPPGLSDCQTIERLLEVALRDLGWPVAETQGGRRIEADWGVELQTEPAQDGTRLAFTIAAVDGFAVASDAPTFETPVVDWSATRDASGPPPSLWTTVLVQATPLRPRRLLGLFRTLRPVVPAPESEARLLRDVLAGLTGLLLGRVAQHD